MASFKETISVDHVCFNPYFNGLASMAYNRRLCAFGGICFNPYFNGLASMAKVPSEVIST